MKEVARFVTEADYNQLTPVIVVWEITLACDLHCKHCGSRAGHRRQDELSTEECLQLIKKLSDLGTREISLIGGEVYLRKDWLTLVKAISDQGMLCSIQTGARNFTESHIVSAKQSGLIGIGVSIDGLPAHHNNLRGADNSYERAIQTLVNAKKHGLKATVNTTICKNTISQLPELLKILAEVGISHWQIQLAVAMGNAVDNEGILLQPYELLDIMPKLADIYKKAANENILVTVGNNIGYFGPYESMWRGFGDETYHWRGCGAGVTAIGIEADGTMKGCPSLATKEFSVGTIKEKEVDELWHETGRLDYIRERSVSDLWGFCKSCYYADICRAGCTWTSHSLFNRPGNNPYCHYRALVLAKDGVRESIVKIADADKSPFAIGEFTLVLEKKVGDKYTEIDSNAYLSKYRNTPINRKQEGSRYKPQQLDLCPNCKQYIWDEAYCPHCGCDVEEERAKYLAHKQHVNAAMRVIQDALSNKQNESPII